MKREAAKIVPNFEQKLISHRNRSGAAEHRQRRSRLLYRQATKHKCMAMTLKQKSSSKSEDFAYS